MSVLKTLFGDFIEYNSELMEQSESLMEKSQELKTNLEQIYDELRSRIGDVRHFLYLN